MPRFLKNTDPRFHLIELRSKAFIFVILLVILGIIGFTVWKQEWFRPVKKYYVIADTSEGLQKGMSVRLSGFRIGKAEKIVLEGPGKVRVDIRVFTEYAHYIRQEALTKVRGENLIGDRFIEVKLEDQAGISPELPEGSRIDFERSKSIEDVVAVLEAKFTPIVDGLGELAVTLPKTAKRLDETVEQATGLLTDLRSEEGDLMSGLATFSEAINEINELAVTLRSDDGGIMEGIASFNSAADTLNTKLGPLVDDLKAGAETLKGAAGEAEALFANTNAMIDDIDDAVDKSMPEVPGMVKKGSDAVEKADDVIDSVRNMWPIRRGKKDKGEDILRTGSDD